MNPPKDFSFLTGEDIFFYLALTLGGHGDKIKANDTEAALEVWKELYDFIPLLFKEPNPAPIKYCLENQLSSII